MIKGDTDKSYPSASFETSTSPVAASSLQAECGENFKSILTVIFLCNGTMGIALGDDVRIHGLNFTAANMFERKISKPHNFFNSMLQQTA